MLSTVPAATTPSPGRGRVPPTPRDLRRVMGRFATGVTVVTTDVDGRPHGMTANSVTSVSLEPPLVLVCVQRESATVREILAADAFAVSILAEHQGGVAERFADPDRPLGTAGFRGIATTPGTTGAPLVDGALGWVEAEVEAVHEGGDHLIVVGRVVGAEHRGGGRPLLFHDGRLTALEVRDGAVA